MSDSSLSVPNVELYLEQPHLEWYEWKNRDRVIQVYGVGYIWYQQYLKSLLILDFLLSIASLIPITSHIVLGSNSYTQYEQFINEDALNSTQSINNAGLGSFIFYIITASYTDAAHPYIYTYFIIHLLSITIHPILYYHYVRQRQSIHDSSLAFEDPFNSIEKHNFYQQESQSHYFKIKLARNNRKKSQKSMVKTNSYHENVSRVSGISSVEMKENKGDDDATPKIIQNLNQHIYIKYSRNVASICCFFMILAIYGICIWLIQSYMYDRLHSLSTINSFTISIWVSVVLSITQSVTDVVWMLFSELLRYIEVHTHEEVANKWECIRLFALRIFSINMFYAIRIYGMNDQQQCSATLLGVQHTLIVVCYFLGDFIADYLWPYFYRAYKRKHGGQYGRDYENWYEFKLSEQYATVAYRHILLSSGSSFIPGLAIIALLGNYVQWKSDQYRVTHLCRISHRLYSSYRSFLNLLGIISVLYFLIGYPKGIIFSVLNSNSFFTCDNLSTS